jgi:hypothetical protein
MRFTRRYPKCRFPRPGHSTTPGRTTSCAYLRLLFSSRHKSQVTEVKLRAHASRLCTAGSLHRWNGIRRLPPIDHGTSTAIIAPQGHTAPVDLHKLIPAPIGPIQVPCAVITTSSAQIVSYVTQLCMSILSDSGDSVRYQVEDKVHIVECTLWLSAQDEWVQLAPQ